MGKRYQIRLLDEDPPRCYLGRKHGFLYPTIERLRVAFLIEDMVEEKVIRYLNGKSFIIEEISSTKPGIRFIY